MSAYITLSTPITDRESLIAALVDCGFDRETIEQHDQAVALVGFEGTAREVRAHLVIRRRHVGSSSNDIGFEHTETGYRFHVSDYDRSRFGASWMKQLQAGYGAHYSAKLERLAAEERRREEARREEERRKLIDAERRAILEKAKKLGYRVEESREGEKIRLVLAKRVY